MILDRIQTKTTFTVEAKNLSSEKLVKGIGFIYKKKVNYEILVNNKLYKIEIIDVNKLQDIDYYFLNRNYTAVVDIIESLKTTKFTMQITFFVYPIVNIFDPFYISLDENILSRAKKTKLISRKEGINDLKRKLKENIIININEENYFIISTATTMQQEVFSKEINEIEEKFKNSNDSKDLDKNIKKRKRESLKKDQKQLERDQKELAFVVHGKNFNLPIKQQNIKNKTRYAATKLLSVNSIEPKDTYTLVRVKENIKFTDGLISTQISSQLTDIIQEDGSYLNTWNKYIDKQGELLINNAKDIGVINLKSEPKRVQEGYELRIEDYKHIEELLQVGDVLNFADNVPSYITDNLSWTEYIGQLEKLERFNINEKAESFEIISIENGFITIKTNKAISEFLTKKIVLSIYGDEVQLKRKLEARKRLLEGRSANPHLGLIIEDSEFIKKHLKQSNGNRLKPLSEDVKKKIFSNNPPTDSQLKAIEIAINTPDIAVIQGPPGTGKTTVITAIIERLHELANKEDIRGQILVAGFQHDAVENIIQRLDINGLPTPKFGKKSTSVADISSYKRIIGWSQKIVEKVSEQLPELSNIKKINKLKGLFKVYINAPSKTLAIDLLNFIIEDLSLAQLNEDIISEAQSILEKIDIKEINHLEELKFVYSLRTTVLGFKDDGIHRNYELLESIIGKQIENKDKLILKKNDFSNLKIYLPKLAALKTKLIHKFYPKPIFKVEKANTNVINLKEKVEVYLSKSSSKKDQINVVLSDYIHGLESNPFALKNLIKEYSYVYSSTTGQSSKASFEKNKNVKEAEFDTLIIDEAARVAPMDLLLAMVLAKRRIILVGDHRQLPHVVEESIINQAGLDQNEFIKESMFSYLKKRANQLEQYDNNKRSITLDQQFRAHPLLGNFVSENFYEPYKEGFKSPLGTTTGNKEDYFYQNLEGIENIPAVWIDVPNSLGSEKKAWFRSCEAEKIINYLRNWVLSDQGKRLTFGIITFYRAQAKIIQDQIKVEFTETEYNLFKNRLQVGTVDSFQGKEFDIVFLSTVRSRDINMINVGQNPFGFLIEKTRLCVSMSRQKKSLVVVGDKELFESKRAEEDVRELNAFLKLCKNEGKVL